MKTKPLSPRNPFVQHLVKKKQGFHQKPFKTTRQQSKIKLRKEWN